MKIRCGANTQSSLSERAAKASFTDVRVTGHGAISDVLLSSGKQVFDVWFFAVVAGRQDKFPDDCG